VTHPILLRKRKGRRYNSLTLRPKGFFSPQDLVRYINDKWESSSFDINSRIEYIEISHKFQIKIAPQELVKLSGNMCKQLGFVHNNIQQKGAGTLAGVTPADLDLLGHVFYVYISCIKECLVGNQYIKLLRLISVRGKPGDNIYESYAVPYYHDLNSKNINSIELSIRDMTGNPIKFEYGTVMMKLHFRKKMK
jgi:hypothetical protein